MNETAFSKTSEERKRREVYLNFRKFLSGSLLPTQLCSRNFQNFRLNCSHFGNSTAFGVSANFSWKFLYHLPLFPNFRKFWLHRKRPLSPISPPRFSPPHHTPRHLHATRERFVRDDWGRVRWHQERTAE